ncbi:MAG: metallophosphoesterase [Alphaproteobacteria bacterium]
MTDLTLAVVADIHHGRDTFTKKGSVALRELDRFLERAREAGADAVIDLGDRISDVDRETDKALLAEVADRFGQVNCPRFHVNGNHDRAFMKAEDNGEALGQQVVTRSVDLGAARLVIWQPDVILTREKGFSLQPGDLGGLAGILDESDQRTILISHVPLSGQSMTGNYWFEDNVAHARYATEQAAIRAVLAAAPCSIVALAGHVHWNSLTTVDGTAHLTLQSLTDTWTTFPHATGSSATLKLSGETLSWQVGGRDPLGLTLSFPHRKRRPVDRLPRFADLTDDPVETYRVMAETEAMAVPA